MKPGIRVGAIRDMDASKANLYGYGVYVGDVTGGPMDQMMEEPWANPKIELDGGGVVWGCECWWGPEELIRKEIGARATEIVPPPDRTADNGSSAL
jgi:hypothetical protein